jgi:hypothetical protein
LILSQRLIETGNLGFSEATHPVVKSFSIVRVRIRVELSIVLNAGSSTNTFGTISLAHSSRKNNTPIDEVLLTFNSGEPFVEGKRPINDTFRSP